MSEITLANQSNEVMLSLESFILNHPDYKDLVDRVTDGDGNLNDPLPDENFEIYFKENIGDDAATLLIRQYCKNINAKIYGLVDTEHRITIDNGKVKKSILVTYRSWIPYRLQVLVRTLG